MYRPGTRWALKFLDINHSGPKHGSISYNQGPPVYKIGKIYKIVESREGKKIISKSLLDSPRKSYKVALSFCAKTYLKGKDIN